MFGADLVGWFRARLPDDENGALAFDLEVARDDDSLPEGREVEAPTPTGGYLNPPAEPELVAVGVEDPRPRP